MISFGTHTLPLKKGYYHLGGIFDNNPLNILLHRQYNAFRTVKHSTTRIKHFYFYYYCYYYDKAYKFIHILVFSLFISFSG